MENVITHNLINEGLVTLTEATKLLPRVAGKRIHVCTLWRWCKKGLRGVNLEYLRVGSKVATTSDALQRFFAALAELDATQPSTYKLACLKNKTRSEASRQRDIENAKAILVRAKIIQTAPREAAKS